MPGRKEPKKGAVGGDTPRGAANTRRSGDARMGKPGVGNTTSPPAEHIGGVEGTGGTETSKYPEEKRVFPE